MIGPSAQQGSNILSNVNDGVAWTAIASPVWLTYLKNFSEGLAALAPAIGVVWLLVQIWAKISEVRDRNRKDQNDK